MKGQGAAILITPTRALHRLDSLLTSSVSGLEFWLHAFPGSSREHDLAVFVFWAFPSRQHTLRWDSRASGIRLCLGASVLLDYSSCLRGGTELQSFLKY